MSHSDSKNKDKTVLVSMISGLFSVSMGKLFTHPIDTIKSKIQVSSGIDAKTGILQIAKSTYKSEGMGGLYKGLPVNIIGSIPGSVLYFGSYEFAKKKMLLGKTALE